MKGLSSNNFICTHFITHHPKINMVSIKHILVVHWCLMVLWRLLMVLWELMGLLLVVGKRIDPHEAVFTGPLWVSHGSGGEMGGRQHHRGLQALLPHLAAAAALFWRGRSVKRQRYHGANGSIVISVIFSTLH